MSAPNPPGHNWSRKVEREEQEEEEDPLDQMIFRSGCAAFHYALQECMSEQRDWRKCQQQVQLFKDCMQEQQKQRMQELQRQKQKQTDS
nr:cytochrome c oxidase assembly factor 4 homolog, mitochondrial isoform X2 [Geotrypetes seraphini]XP_033804686.1 cytochrome c oxidase assembly factor 4 homolog, mitochondrial isoform X2 [Geotrypetes seraphini]XP_033804687.1 cytochrome c oxidase assembly factor 4 homolog, mitochondrial isoform X2 [Geotrypetes seraphini]